MPSRVLQLRAPLLWLLVPLSAGLVAAQRWPLPAAGPWPFLAMALGAALLALCAADRNRRAWWPVGLVLSTGLAGYMLLHLRYPYLHEWSGRPPREVTVVLEVRLPYPPAPAARSLTGLATITSSRENDPALRGRQVYYSAIRRISAAPQRSGHYLVRGVLEPLSPETDGPGFADYLVNAGVRHRLTRAHILGEVRAPDRVPVWCARIEDRLETILSRGLADQPGPRSLYLAMLLGEKAVMSADQQNAFMRSGTFHIFSISGLHVAVIAWALRRLFLLVRMPQKPTVILTLVLLWLYVQITGASSPAMRAFLMIGCLLVSPVFRLPGNALAALTASALATLLLDPLQLFSTGFQMSYAVVAALILMGSPLAERWQEHWRPFQFLPKPDWHREHHWIDETGRWLIGAGAGCWAAFLASTPAGIGFFGLISLGSLLANLVIIPVSSGIIRLGFVSLLAGLLGLAPLSAGLNLLAAEIISLTDFLLQHGVGLPGVYFPARFRADWLAPLSLLLMTGVMLLGAGTGWARRWGGFWPPVILLALLLILGVKFG